MTKTARRGEDDKVLLDDVVVRPRGQILLITAAAALAEVLVVAGGYLAGNTPHAVFLGMLTVFFGLVFAVASVFLPQPRATQSVNRLIALGLCVYVFFLDGAGAVIVVNTPSLLIALLLLSPVVIGGVILPRRGSWLGGVGFWLVLFSAVVSLAYNASGRWLSALSFFRKLVF